MFRRVLIGSVALATCAAGVVAAGPAAQAQPSAKAVAAAAGGYVALPTEVRALNPRTLSHGATVSVAVTGKGGVPTSGVGSVAISLTASKATAAGGLTAYSGTRPGTTNLQFAKGRTTTSTAIVRVSAGKITVANAASAGTVSVLVDVSGYYATAASSAQPGAYHPITPTRFVDTRTGGRYGNRKGAVPAYGTVATTIGGKAAIPRSAEVAALTVTVVGPASTGSLRIYRAGEVDPGVSAVHFATGRSVASFAMMGLGTGVEDPADVGRINIVNNSPGAVQVVVDVVGYYDAGVAQTASQTRWLPAARAAQQTVRANTPTSIPLAGKGGTPLTGVAAAIVTLHVVSPTVSGALQAWRSGVTRPSSTAVLRWSAGETAAVTTIVPVSTTGRFAIDNLATKSVSMTIDVQGFVPATSIAPPSTKSIARYPNDLVSVTDESDLTANVDTMKQHGCDDAEAGRRYVLLDLGTQTVSPPRSESDPGILIAGTGDGPEGVRLNYGDLAPIVSGYLTGFAECRTAGLTATVAVGTNNDGTWTEYKAAQRGIDFAKLVDAIGAKAATGLTVVGADDIESLYGSTKASDAITWETNYLATTKRPLVYNGSLHGCPRTFGAPTGTCGDKWTMANYRTLTHNGDRISVLPQVYFDYQATQWANFAAYLHANKAPALDFDGSLTQYAADQRSFTPAQGWTSLYRALSAVAGPQLPLAVDIGYEG